MRLQCSNAIQTGQEQCETYQKRSRKIQPDQKEVKLNRTKSEVFGLTKDIFSTLKNCKLISKSFWVLKSLTYNCHVHYVESMYIMISCHYTFIHFFQILILSFKNTTVNITYYCSGKICEKNPFQKSERANGGLQN